MPRARAASVSASESREQRRLRDVRAGQRLDRPLEAVPADRQARGGLGLQRDSASRSSGSALEQVGTHADLLRSLTRIDECERPISKSRSTRRGVSHRERLARQRSAARALTRVTAQCQHRRRDSQATSPRRQTWQTSRPQFGHGRRRAGHPPGRRRPHAAEPEVGRFDLRLHGRRRPSRPATGSPSTTTRTPKSSSSSCAAAIVAELDGEPQPTSRPARTLHPDQRQAPAPERGRRGRLHRLPPRPARAAAADGARRHRATRLAGRLRAADATKRGHRNRRRRPGRRHARRVLGDRSPRADRDAADHVLRPVRLPLADRGGVRLRPCRGRARRPGDPAHGPLRPVRGRRRRWRRCATVGLELEQRRPRADGCQPGQRRRRDDDPRGRTTSRSATEGRSGSSTPSYASPFLYQALVPSTLASEVALKFGAHGPAVVVSTGCTSGIDAIGYGHQLIQDGEADIVIAGAAESGISPISMACFDPIKATSRRNDDAGARLAAVRPRPRRVRDGRGRRPCSSSRSSRRALARGAHVYCEVAGFASRGNAFHMTGLRPDGAGDGRGDLGRDAAGRPRTRGRRLHQRARLGHQAERPARDGGLQASRSASTRTRSRSARSSR